MNLYDPTALVPSSESVRRSMYSSPENIAARLRSLRCSKDEPLSRLPEECYVQMCNIVACVLEQSGDKSFNLISFTNTCRTIAPGSSGLPPTMQKRKETADRETKAARSRQASDNPVLPPTQQPEPQGKPRKTRSPKRRTPPPLVDANEGLELVPALPPVPNPS